MASPALLGQKNKVFVVHGGASVAGCCWKLNIDMKWWVRALLFAATKRFEAIERTSLWYSSQDAVSVVVE